MLYEPHLEKLVRFCVDFRLDFWVLRVVSLLNWLVILPRGAILSAVSSVTKLAVAPVSIVAADNCCSSTISLPVSLER